MGTSFHSDEILILFELDFEILFQWVSVLLSDFDFGLNVVWVLCLIQMNCESKSRKNKNLEALFVVQKI